MRAISENQSSIRILQREDANPHFLYRQYTSGVQQPQFRPQLGGHELLCQPYLRLPDPYHYSDLLPKKNCTDWIPSQVVRDCQPEFPAARFRYQLCTHYAQYSRSARNRAVTATSVSTSSPTVNGIGVLSSGSVSKKNYTGFQTQNRRSEFFELLNRDFDVSPFCLHDV